jgi:hypothetical protein
VNYLVVRRYRQVGHDGVTGTSKIFGWPDRRDAVVASHLGGRNGDLGWPT